jgi:hypothetical protein
MSPEWRTQIDPAHAASYGCADIHVVFFQPLSDRGGACPCVSVQIPEASQHAVKAAMAHARQSKARVMFMCDTHDQAVAIANRASALLPNHRRVPYERAEAAAWNLTADA